MYISLILCLFLVEIFAEIGLPNYRPVWITGLSLKNFFLYFLFLCFLTHIIIKRDWSFLQYTKVIHIFYILLIVYGSISVVYNSIFSNIPHYNVNSAIQTLKEDLVDTYLLFLIFSYFVDTKEKAHFFFKFFLVLMTIGCILTIIGVYIPSLNFFGFDEGNIRANGPMGEPNQTGAVLALFILFAISMFWKSTNISRYIYALSVSLMLATLLLTSSRGGLLGVILGLCIFIWLLRKKMSLGVIVLVIVSFFLFFGLSWFLAPESYKNLFLSRIGMLEVHNKLDLYYISAGRTYIWKRGLEVLIKSPVLGYGWAAFRFFTHYSSHNTFLEVLVSVGIIGFILYISIFFFLLKILYKTAVDSNEPYSTYIFGIIAGICALLCSVFFVNLYKPWLVVWSFLGVCIGYANLLLIQTDSKEDKNESLYVNG